MATYLGEDFSPLPVESPVAGKMRRADIVIFGASPTWQERRYWMRGWSASQSGFRIWKAGTFDVSAAEYTGDGKPLTDVVCLGVR